MNRLATWLEKNNGKILAAMIGAYVLIVSLACLSKYQHFLYSGLDLAIFNNALWNTVHGNWWWSTIQGHNYWGDHFEPILILFLPIYYLWQSPILLLILQTIFLGLAAWPIYLIAKKIYLEEEPATTKDPMNSSNHGTLRSAQGKLQVTALGISFIWLINPLVHNINLYEFHAIAFLPFFFFWLFYFYLKLKEQPSKKLILHSCIFIFLCLMIREDVAFIVLIFLILTWIDALKNKNKILLRVTSYQLLVTVFYLILSFKIIGHFSPTSFSPFAYYYGWLGSTGFTGLIKHILTLTNLEMVLGFLAPFFFLPIIKLKWLLLALVPFGQITLSAAGGGAQVWQIHYGALFLPALMIAFIYSWPRADDYVTRKFQSPGLFLAIIIIFNLCLWPSFGPWGMRGEPAIDRMTINKMIEKIEPEESVLASYRFLPQLSSREKIYSLHYYFLSVQQFAQGKYTLAEEPKYILLDKNDYQQYDEILRTSAWGGQHYRGGYERLEKLFSNYQKIEEKATVSLWQKI